MNFKKVVELSVLAAKEAGKAIKELSLTDISVRNKSVGSSQASQIVTTADFKSQEIILNRLKPLIIKYDIGLLAEEAEDNSSRFSKEFFFAIDPLDGTLAYSKGNPGYFVSISLISRDGSPHITVLYDPYRDNIYHALKGGGVFKNMKPFKPCIKKEVSWVYDISLKESQNYSKYRDIIETIARQRGFQIKEIDYGGAVFNAIYVLENSPAIYFKPPKKKRGGGAIWDFSGTNLIYNELNNSYLSTDSLGRGLTFNRKSIFFNDIGIIYSSDLELFNTFKEITYD